MSIAIVKAVLDEKTVVRLLELSQIWVEEDNCFGMVANTRDDLVEPCYIALDGEDIIGYAFGECIKATGKWGEIKEGDPCFRIDELYVLPEYRNQGIGKKLFNCLQQEAKAKAPYLVLNTSSKAYQRILRFYCEDVGMTFHSAFLMKKF